MNIKKKKKILKSGIINVRIWILIRDRRVEIQCVANPFFLLAINIFSNYRLFKFYTLIPCSSHNRYYHSNLKNFPLQIEKKVIEI